MKRIILFTLCATLPPLVITGAGAQSTPAMSVDDFRDSLGVNTHIIYKDGAYARVSNVIDDLNYIGIKHVRDGVPMAWWPGSASLGDYAAMANGGILFDLIVDLGIRIDRTKSIVEQNILMMDAIAAVTPNSIIAIEGPNEINNWPVPPYDGYTGTGAAVAFQDDLYKAVHSDANLPHVVYDMTGSPMVDSLAGRADVENMHSYPHNGQQPFGYISGAFARNYAAAESYPGVITELGNFSLPPTWPAGKPWWEGYTELGVDEATQAKMIVNAYFDAAAVGVMLTYVYELLDEKEDPTSTLAEFHYGLFKFDHTPKVSATALHNLNTILTTNGAANANVFANGGLDYTLHNLPASAGTLLLQKTDGAFVLALWNNTPFWTWTQTQSAPIHSSPADVLLQLEQQASAIKIYDPLKSPSPFETRRYTQGTILEIPDHPILVEITLNPLCGSIANGGTAWDGDIPGSSLAAAKPQQCAYGGTVTTTWTKQSLKLCVNGVLTNTGKTRIIDPVAQQPVCNAPGIPNPTANNG
ncbi:MAG: hypothetical protein ABSB19_17815 [Methylomonas sp.]